MDCRLLVRPEVKIQKKTTKDANAEKVLPADLAAAYVCYHDNLVEQRKLEQKLQIIDIETKQMKRNFRQQREILERQLRKSESDYWNCHRVFSAETLITESDSYRKRFYTGPQPTKAKLPRRTLERLSQLVRSLQAEEDLETLSRFQRCARYARRKKPADHGSVSSLTLSQEDSCEFDACEQQRLTELLNDRSTDRVDRLSSNTSIKEKRIRSAPVRVVSRTPAPEECNETQHSAGSRQYSPKKLQLDISQNSSSKVEESKGMTYSGGREKASVRFAWVEKEKTGDTVDDMIDSPADGIGKEPSRDIGLMQTSPEHETSQNSGHQYCVANLFSISPECRMLRSSGRVSSHQDPLRGESSFVHLQSKEAKISKQDYCDPKFSTTCQDQAFKKRPAVEEQRGGDENLDQFDSTSAKGATTPSNGWDHIRIAYLDNKKSSVPDSCGVLKNEDFAHILQERGKERDDNPPESDGECSFRKHAASQRNDNEAQHFTQRKRDEEDAEVTTNNTQGLAQLKRGRKISIALPKSSLHGLSSCRKSLTPRTQQKPLQRTHRALIKAKDEQEVRNNSANLHAKMLPKNAAKKPVKEKQAKDTQKKKKPPIFKRACLSDALFSGQTHVESQLRNRVQGFLGTIYNVVETSEKETGEEDLQ